MKTRKWARRKLEGAANILSNFQDHLIDIEITYDEEDLRGDPSVGEAMLKLAHLRELVRAIQIAIEGVRDEWP